jgi:phosphate transport system ATP-binding protein
LEFNTHISVRNLSVFYGENQALKNVTVDIPDKKVTAIIGPSGCGKTTLLKCFNRLIDSMEEVKVSGKVLVDGEDIFAPGAEVTHIRKKMGLLSQKPYPLPMSIYDNVAYGPRIHGIKNKRKLDEIVERHLKESNLWDETKDRLNQPASGLSVGQQQRLCLARGLAVEPDIILGDEPTSALDPISSEKVEDLLLSLKKNYTVIIVSHVLRQAKRLADYVVFLYLGEVVEASDVEKFFNNPTHELSKKYIKGMMAGV